MNDTHKEQISSLLDNELSSLEANELLGAIESNQGLREKFDRYALIRDALNEDVVVHEESFLKRVQAALVIEPTVLAPRRKKPENKKYVAAALAASFAIFAVIIFDVGLFNYSSPQHQTVASIEAEQEKILAVEGQLDEEFIENENTLRPQFVTFER